MASIIRANTLDLLGTWLTVPERVRGIDLSPRVLRAYLSRTTLNLWIGGILVVALLLLALAGPLLAPYEPDKVMAGARLAPPTATHPFGTDSLGRDMFSRVLVGARIAVWTMTLSTVIAASVGILLGLVAGYAGGWLGELLSRAVEIAQAFPGILLALVIVARLGPSLENAVIALGIISIPGFFRLTRSLTLSTRNLLYVQAAHSVGAGNFRILFRHILPNLTSSLVITATMRAGMLLLASGGLSFIGLGAQPPMPEWGALLLSGRNYLDSAPWLAICPGLFLTLAVVGSNLLGDGLRDWLDPCRERPI